MAVAIQRVTVEGSASIASAEVELRGINILVGANGAGKSNFLRLLGLLGYIVDRQLQEGIRLAGGAGELLRQAQRPGHLRIEVEADEHAYIALLTRTPDDELVFDGELVGTVVHGPLTGLVGARLGAGHSETLLHDAIAEEGRGLWVARVISSFRGCRVFCFQDTGRAAPVRGPGPVADHAALRSDGGNLAAVLWFLREDQPEVYQRIVAAVRQVAPCFDDFDLRPERHDRIRLRWHHAGEDTIFSTHRMSDGTLRFVCLATLLLGQTLPRVLVLDEPELGLHPSAIVQVAAMVKAAASRSQIVLATESTTLLRQFAPEDLIVVEHDAGSSASVFSRPGPERLRAWLKEYSLGQL